MSIRIAILEDETFLLEGMIAKLPHLGRVEVVHSSGELDRFVDACLADPPQVAIVDLFLPSPDFDVDVPLGLDVPMRLSEAGEREGRPEVAGIPALALSKAATRSTVRAADRKGFKGFLPKEDTTSKEVLDAVERLSQGGRHWHHERIASYRGPDDPRRDPTEEEIAILMIAARAGLADDKTRREAVCGELHMAEATFYRRQRSIVRKLGARRLDHAVTVAILEGIIPARRSLRAV